MTKKDKDSLKDNTKDNQSMRSSRFVWEAGDLIVEKAPKKTVNKHTPTKKEK